MADLIAREFRELIQAAILDIELLHVGQ